jgi:transposase
MNNLSPCLVGMEACMGAHYWARLFKGMGHEVKLMSPWLVKPYIASNKNDANDAEGIAEAVTRPKMKFVAIKSVEQQDVLLLHRTRELVVKTRTSKSNQIRGLLMEYGVVVPKGLCFIRELLDLLERNEKKLTARAQGIFKQLYEEFKACDGQVTEYDKQIESIANGNSLCKELMKIEGIGPVTSSAVVATVGDAKYFKNGREMAAWLGLVPKQHSSGDKIKLSGISKRGDRYVRQLLVHGARAVVKGCEKKKDGKSIWVADKKVRRGYNKATVALANKNARIVWAIMAKGECYRKPVTN